MQVPRLNRFACLFTLRRSPITSPLLPLCLKSHSCGFNPLRGNNANREPYVVLGKSMKLRTSA
jgi:hypothetical protein